eukprot:Filipodium_phascolosomae@DN1370_c0_g1_i1.p1
MGGLTNSTWLRMHRNLKKWRPLFLFKCHYSTATMVSNIASLATISGLKMTEPMQFVTAMNEVFRDAAAMSASETFWNDPRFEKLTRQLGLRLAAFSSNELYLLIDAFSRAGCCPPLLLSRLPKQLLMTDLTDLSTMQLSHLMLSSSVMFSQCEEAPQLICKITTVIREHHWGKLLPTHFQIIILSLSNVSFPSSLRVSVVVPFLEELSLDILAHLSEFSTSQASVIFLSTATIGFFEDAFQKRLCAFLSERLLPWNEVHNSILPENLATPTDIANIYLGLATSNLAPVGLLVRAASMIHWMKFANMTSDDALTIAWSMCCLQLFDMELLTDVLQHFMNSVPLRRLDGSKQNQLRQVAISMQLEANTEDMIRLRATKPNLWMYLYPQVSDGHSEPELASPDTGVVEEIQALLKKTLESGIDENTSMAAEAAVVINFEVENLYLVDVAVMRIPAITNLKTKQTKQFPVPTTRKVAYLVDGGTYMDLESPNDPWLRMKHRNLRNLGWEVVWIRVVEWRSMGNEQKQQFLLEALDKEAVIQK